MPQKISVAMCTYNGEKYLEKQLESIANQSVLPEELVVCDDCSKDRTLCILDKFSEISPFKVRIYKNEKNLGSTKNFEKCIDLCNHEIIALCDQDDVWLPEKLKKIMYMFSLSDITGVVFTDANIVDENLNPLGYNMWESTFFTEKEKRNIVNGNPIKTLLKHNVATGATMAFKSVYKDRIFPIPKNWFHDAWITFVIALFEDIRFIEEPLINYRQHSNQQVGGIKNESFSMEMALRDNKMYYKKEYEHYLAAYNKLLQLSSEAQISDKLVKMTGQRVDYLKWRSDMPNAKYKRFSKVMKNLVTLQYHRYANGFLSAAKDLLLN
ncbi:MAG: glycosyltransferase family 2 protein [Bacillota bacterium]|nr:glycosyltransferase family 2 protein [Bacillota bacterium]